MQPSAESGAGFHAGAITSLSAASRRPLLATASKDHTVCIWDFRRQLCLTAMQATHPVTALAVHPWGTEMVIATRDSAHAHVIANELIVGERLADSSGGFTIISYSRRGGLVACVRRNVVLVYVTGTYALAATLRGHPEEVADVQWSEDGFRLVTVCRAAVYSWSMETYSKVR